MTKIHRIIQCAVLMFFYSGPSFAADTFLTLADALELAVAHDDPSVTQYLAQAKSVKEIAEADAQLPDPRLRFGVANLAIDSFNFNQEPMTQLQIGLHQSFPTVDRRRFQRAKGEANSDVYVHMAAARALMLDFEVMKLWLHLLSLKSTGSIIEHKKQNLAAFLSALEAKFEGGKAGVEEVLTMESELALLDDRLQSLDQKEAALRAALSRYIGVDAAQRPIAGSHSDIARPAARQILEENIGTHPEILAEQAHMRASEHGVSLANANYKPNWGVDVGYGYRADGRADLASAMVTLDVPLFTGNRQDKRLSAAKQARQAARLRLQVVELELLKNIRATYAIWQKSADRIQLYETVVLTRARAASVASENAYASGSADFAELVRTHITELDARIKLETIRLERSFAQARLTYFKGGRS